MKVREHRFYTCPSDCDDPHCNFCRGGLAYCEVCKKGEADLEELCPGPPKGPPLRLGDAGSNPAETDRPSSQMDDAET